MPSQCEGVNWAASARSRSLKASRRGSAGAAVQEAQLCPDWGSLRSLRLNMRLALPGAAEIHLINGPWRPQGPMWCNGLTKGRLGSSSPRLPPGPIRDRESCSWPALFCPTLVTSGRPDLPCRIRRGKHQRRDVPTHSLRRSLEGFSCALSPSRVPLVVRPSGGPASSRWRALAEAYRGSAVSPASFASACHDVGEPTNCWGGHSAR